MTAEAHDNKRASPCWDELDGSAYILARRREELLSVIWMFTALGSPSKFTNHVQELKRLCEAAPHAAFQKYGKALRRIFKRIECDAQARASDGDPGIEPVNTDPYFESEKAAFAALRSALPERAQACLDLGSRICEAMQFGEITCPDYEIKVLEITRDAALATIPLAWLRDLAQQPRPRINVKRADTRRHRILLYQVCRLERGLHEHLGISPVQTTKGKTGGKSVLWDEHDTDFISGKDALDFANLKLPGKSHSPSWLSKLTTPECAFRYMRSGQRCRVHAGEFIAYIRTLEPPVDFEKLVESERKSRKERAAKIRRKNSRSG